jgi:hypothetical protein
MFPEYEQIAYRQARSPGWPPGMGEAAERDVFNGRLADSSF